MKRVAPYQDVLRAPDNVVAEIIGGELYMSPRPAPRHALAKTVLGAELLLPFQHGRGGAGGWWILLEPELLPLTDLMGKVRFAKGYDNKPVPDSDARRHVSSRRAACPRR